MYHMTGGIWPRIFMWLHKNFQFFGMEPLPTFSCYDVLKNADVEGDLDRLQKHVTEAFSGLET